MRWRPEHPLQLALGLTLWSVWFVAVYGGHAVACRAGPSAGAISVGLVLFTLIVAGALAWAAWHNAAAARRAPEGVGRFLAGAGAALHGVAAVATFFVGLLIVLIPACI
jgi:hypothetical protein